MKHIYFHLFLILLFIQPFTQKTLAQATKSMKIGEYYLTGVREVGSGFRFNADYTFDFFFSYGTMDRMTTGTWEQKGDSLLLNTPRKPATDFILATSSHTPENQLIIRVKDKNTLILGYIYCRLETTDGRTLEASSTDEGIITFDKAPVKSISLLHELWPDRISEFSIAEAEHNYFEFTIGRWIVDVEFKNLALHVQDKGLVGGHPLLQGHEFRYTHE